MAKRKLILKAPVTTQSGYGVHSRQILTALLSSGEFDVSVRPINWGNTSFIMSGDPVVAMANRLAEKAQQEAAAGVKYDVSVQVTIPNEFERMARVNVGVTAGIEVNIASPEWISKINDNVDFVIVPSKHSRDVLLASRFMAQDGRVLQLNKEPILVHEGYDTRYFYPRPDGQEDRETLHGQPLPPFNFLSVGIGFRGFGKERKNLSNTIRWFCETFKGRSDVGLVLKAAVVNGSYMDFAETLRIVGDIKQACGVGELPRVTVVHGRLGDEEMGELYRHPRIRALLSLTCGEGFGLPMLEAAACGLPVMATAWSGHLDFLAVEGKRTFVPIEYDMVPVPDECIWPGVIERGTQWAMPRESDAKDKMLRMALSPDKPTEWAAEHATTLGASFSLERSCARFMDVLTRCIGAHAMANPATPDEFVSSVGSRFSPEDDGKKLLFTMPMSAGDVYVSTAVVSSLKRKYPDHKIFYATQPQYASILEGNPDIHRVIPWEEWMTNIPLTEQVFDEVYTPNLAIQMTFSNWVHRGNGRRLAEEMANQCGVELGEYRIGEVEPSVKLPERFIAFHPGSGKGQWSARNYLHWQEVVDNLRRELPDVAIVQVGTQDDPAYEGCVNFLGKTKDYRQLAFVLARCELLMGIDSVSMHIAAGLGRNVVALFGSSYASSTGPSVDHVDRPQTITLLETKDRYSCKKACYQYTCKVDADHPCINEVKPRDVFDQVIELLKPSTAKLRTYLERRPRISGYCHVLNAQEREYPYVESITSMLGFCDEVVVVDGGSDDGTRERIEAIGDERIKIYENAWDWDEPGMDGMQKAFGRALCSGEYLWQQDIDEVMHEDDYEKVRAMVKRFPRDVDLVHLPIIELWGDASTVRTDRHSWKWRVSRSNFRITHGIAKHARIVDEKTGRVYARKGMSDGCEYVDIMSNEYIQHRGFYNDEIERQRVTDPAGYGETMNGIFERLPSVFHYSWADIPRKITNFKQFWNKCWNNLYRDSAPEDRFPDIPDMPMSGGHGIYMEKARELIDRGGERPAPTFKLRRSNPKIMKDWISMIGVPAVRMVKP